MTALIDVTLPALDEPECVVETAAGRLRVPGRRLPARTVSLDAELAKRLVMAAREAASRAHAPYSNFHVGAAVIMADDPEQRILTGSNIENASFGATVCGERNALHCRGARLPAAEAAWPVHRRQPGRGSVRRSSRICRQ